jgi:hypothetical protein
MKMKPMDYLELPAKIKHDENTRRYREMCSVALTALSYIDMENLDSEAKQEYAAAVNAVRRVKMRFEYS